MGKSGGKGANTKKEAGNAKKAAVAAEKAAKEQAVRDAVEDAQWKKGSKDTSKKESAEAKKAEAARKKAERDALLDAENEGARAKPKGANQKTAVKKSRGLDLSQLDSPSSPTPLSSASRSLSSSQYDPQPSALNATGIDAALDALTLTSGADVKIDRHPERRFKAAYAVFEARRLPEVEVENPGLRRQQRIEIVRKEFEKSEENPFNQVAGRYDMSREEMAQLRRGEKERMEGVLGSGS